MPEDDGHHGNPEIAYEARQAREKGRRPSWPDRERGYIDETAAALLQRANELKAIGDDDVACYDRRADCAGMLMMLMLSCGAVSTIALLQVMRRRYAKCHPRTY